MLCCGGTIDPITYKCDYCGMAYENNRIMLNRIEVTQLPVKELRCTHYVDTKLATELAIKSMARSFAESLPPFMKIRTERSVLRMGYMTSTIKIVKPEINYEDEIL